jgi:hypothetical protein
MLLFLNEPMFLFRKFDATWQETIYVPIFPGLFGTPLDDFVKYSIKIDKIKR